MAGDARGCGGLRLWAKLVAASARAQMIDRANFVLAAVGVFLATGIEIVGVWALFARFGTLKGWTLPEVAFFYGTVATTFAVADAVSIGFDGFAAEVRAGGFDRVLLRPRSTLLQLFGVGVATRRIGRLAQGALVLGLAIPALHLEWDAWRLGLVGFAVAGGIAMFVGLFVLQATAAFWTVESLEVFNAFTYGGTVAAQYPITIYDGWFRKLFTFVVPLACVTYFPFTLVLGKEDVLGVPAAVRAAAPIAGFVFLAVAFAAWGVGVRRYASTGS